MYEIGDRYQDTNGYILVFQPDHPKSMKSGAFRGYVYEHVLVAEDMLGRPIPSGDVVHHLDSSRSNNSPENLLVISGPMHTKLHQWLDKHTIIPNERQKLRIEKGCIRCKACDTPINDELIYCSDTCYRSDIRRYERPNKEILEKLIWELPTTKVAKLFNVSDVAISKLCKQYEIEKPGRGYWTKKAFEKV